MHLCYYYIILFLSKRKVWMKKCQVRKWYTIKNSIYNEKGITSHMLHTTYITNGKKTSYDTTFEIQYLLFHYRNFTFQKNRSRQWNPRLYLYSKVKFFWEGFSYIVRNKKINKEKWMIGSLKNHFLGKAI